MNLCTYTYTVEPV